MKRRYHLDSAGLSFKLGMKMGAGHGDFGADRIEIAACTIACRYQFLDSVFLVAVIGN